MTSKAFCNIVTRAKRATTRQWLGFILTRLTCLLCVFINAWMAVCKCLKKFVAFSQYFNLQIGSYSPQNTCKKQWKYWLATCLQDTEMLATSWKSTKCFVKDWACKHATVGGVKCRNILVRCSVMRDKVNYFSTTSLWWLQSTARHH